MTFTTFASQSSSRVRRAESGSWELVRDLQPVDSVLTGIVPVDVLVRRLTGLAAVVGHHETHANVDAL